MNPEERARKILEIDSSDRDHGSAAREIYEHGVYLALHILGPEAARGGAPAYTLEQQNEARAKARRIVADVRRQISALEPYTDRQVWQAVLDARSAWKDLVALVFFDHIMAGRTPPPCPYELEDPA